jgi:hypothetical protein
MQLDGSVKIRLKIGLAVRDTISDLAAPVDIDKLNWLTSTRRTAI